MNFWPWFLIVALAVSAAAGANISSRKRFENSRHAILPASTDFRSDSLGPRLASHTS